MSGGLYATAANAANAAQGRVFFIAGLPRSRTAWLANLLSYGNAFCWHDLWGRVAEMDEFRAHLEFRHVPHIGNADPGNLLHFEKLTQQYPEAQWIVVNRPIAEVQESCRRMGVSDMSMLELLARKMEEVRGRAAKVVELDFHALAAQDVAELFAGLLPEWKSPAERNEMLDTLQVQAFAPVAFARIAEAKARGIVAPEGLTMTETNRRYLAAVQALCAPQPGAFAWFQCVLEAATVWDHCVDGDGVSPAMADRVFTSMLTEWPFNEWWVANRAALVPALVAARSAWKWSNSQDAPKLKAYDLYTELPAVIAWLIGGNPLVEKFMPGIRDLAHALLVEDELRDGGKK